MSKAKTPAISKKKIRLHISEVLENTFSDLQQVIGKARFRRNIKKASKALSANLKDIPGASSKLADTQQKSTAQQADQ